MSEKEEGSIERGGEGRRGEEMVMKEKRKMKDMNE